jgi:HEAT repeat protein
VAVRMLGLIGRERAVAVMAEALGDDKLRGDAIATLQQIPAKSAAEALVAFARSASPVDRCSVIHSLGLRGCAVSVAYLRRAAIDKDANVQVAAAKALGQAGDLSALPLVREIARNGATQVRPVAVDASLRLAEAAVRAGKTDQGLAVYDEMMAMAKTDLNRIAAIAGYARVAGKDGAARLASTLGKLGDKADRQIAKELIRMRGPDVTQAIVKAYASASVKPKQTLLAVLGARRDAASLQTITGAAKDKSEEVRGAAIYALASVGKPEMDAIVIEALYKDTPRVQGAAADAYTTIAQRLFAEDRAGNEAKVLKVYNDLLGKAQVEHVTKIAALEGIAMIASPSSAGAVEKLLGHASAKVRDAAGRAYLAIAGKLDAKKDRDKALAMYNRLVDASAVPGGEMQTVVRRLRELGDKSNIAAKLGMITHWWVIGPWPNKDYDAYDKAFFPEKEVNLTKVYKDGGRELKWKPVTTTNPEGRVDLRAQFKDNQNRAAYAYAEVTSDRGRDVIFRTGSDDGMKLWVNGKDVFGQNGPRSLAVDMDASPGKLAKGVNKILVKVLNGGGAWEFCCRATTPDGKPVKLDVRQAK